VNARFEHVSPARAAEPGLRADLLRLWVDATNAGGSIGFVVPVSSADIAPRLDAALVRVAEGVDALGILVDEGTDDDTGRAIAMGFLVDQDSPVQPHWQVVGRLAVHPDVQGRGHGQFLMAQLHELARSLGLHHLALSVRDGEGLEPFYERCGYRRWGVHPAALRLGDADVRDEIWMVHEL